MKSSIAHSRNESVSWRFRSNYPDLETFKNNVADAIRKGSDYEDIANDAYFQKAARVFLDKFKKEQAMFAPSTQVRLDRAWLKYLSWCEQKNKPSLPSSPQLVADYLKSRAKYCHRNTLNVERWAISIIHQAAGCPDPTSCLLVKNTMRGIVKNKVRREDEHIQQATPFKDHHLDRIIELWKGSNYLPDKRNVALLCVAYESMLRSAEIVNIKVQHITINNDGSATLEIPFTKTNQSDDGSEYAYLSPEAVELIEEYLNKADIDRDDGGYLFRAVSRFSRVREPKRDFKTNGKIHKQMTTRSIENIFKKTWNTLNPKKKSSVEYRAFSAHSARVGAAQDLLEQGFNSAQIRQAGRWKSDTMVMRYGQHISVKKSAMALSRKARKYNLTSS